MKRSMLLAAVLLAASLPAGAIDPAVLQDPAQQQRYKALIHELRCLQCQGETVADTPAEFANDLRRQVREMIESGRSDDDVRQYLVDRYGEIILLRPRWSFANSWLWLAPALLLGLGAFVGARVLRQRRQLLASDASEPDEEESRA
jgi:cytochrome c-type biogenesis protein CcmH